MKEVYGLLFKIGTATTIYKTTQIKSAICKSCKKAEKHFHHIEVGYRK